MSDDANGQPGSGDGQDLDMGEPISELVDLREDPTAGFLDRIRGGIHRRFAASDTVDFALVVFFKTALSYILLVIESVSAPFEARDKREGSEADG